MAEDIVKRLFHPGSPIAVIFGPKRRYPIPRGTPSAGAKKYTGYKKLGFSTEIAVYLGNGAR